MTWEDTLYKLKIKKWAWGVTREDILLFVFFVIFTIAVLATPGCGGYSSLPFIPENCTVMKAGTTATLKCPDGTSVDIVDGSKGDTGDTGARGSDGTSGVNGTNGTNGTPGTVITSIEFCPGSTTYEERGLCIDGTIYAVYWSGSTAFLTAIIPGTYTTTQLSNNCTFTVSPNCQVSH